MGKLSEYEQDNARILLMGDPKTKKTTWALQRAEEGFNVLIFNGDKGIGTAILSNISQAAKERITVIDCADTSARSEFVFVMSKFMKGEKIIWDDTNKKQANIVQDKDAHHIVIEPKKLTKYDIVIIDSYTKLVQSSTLRHAQANNIDLSEAAKTDWDGYGEQGRYLDWFLGRMTDFKCHFILIAHVRDQEKRIDKNKVERLGMFPVSSSQPHARTIGQQFSDILFTNIGDNLNYLIDTRNTPDRIGGSRNIPPGIYNMDDIKLAHCVGYGVPDNLPPGDAVTFYGPGELQSGKPVTTNITPPQTTQITVKG